MFCKHNARLDFNISSCESNQINKHLESIYPSFKNSRFQWHAYHGVYLQNNFQEEVIQMQTVLFQTQTEVQMEYLTTPDGEENQDEAMFP